MRGTYMWKILWLTLALLAPEAPNVNWAVGPTEERVAWPKGPHAIEGHACLRWYEHRKNWKGGAARATADEYVRVKYVWRCVEQLRFEQAANDAAAITVLRTWGGEGETVRYIPGS